MIPTGQRLLFEYTIQHFEQWVTIADLDVIRSRIVRPDSVWQVEAVDRGARVGWTTPPAAGGCRRPRGR